MGIQKSDEGPDDCDRSPLVNCKRVRESQLHTLQFFGCNVELTCLSARVLTENVRSEEGWRHSELKSQIDEALEFHRACFGEAMDSFFQRLLAERLIRNPGDYTVNEFPILFINAMRAQQALPFYLCVVYEVGDPS